VIGNLVPTLKGRAIPDRFNHSRSAAQGFATINLNGLLLGSDKDDVLVAFYRNGKVYKVFDVFTPSCSGAAGQPAKQLSWPQDERRALRRLLA